MRRIMTLTVAALMALGGAHAAQAESRTAGRSVMGEMFYPKWLMQRPLYDEFSPRHSNYHPQHQHSMQWYGQYWDTAAWNADWTPDKTISRFFAAKIFHARYMEKSSVDKKTVMQVPVLELGPKFWSLSDLDRRRALKLFADESGVFNDGTQSMFLLRDWKTREVLGNVTPDGMYLN